MQVESREPNDTGCDLNSSEVKAEGGKLRPVRAAW